MAVSLGFAQENIDAAAAAVYGADRRVRSVGIGEHESGYGFQVIRNMAQVVPLSGTQLPGEIDGVPITYRDRMTEVAPVVKLPFSGPGSPGTASLVPEQGKHNPILCGLQVQNYDDDVRQGEIGGGNIVVGSLGCFVVLSDGSFGIVSNNHVLAGENRGIRRGDRILQPGDGAFSGADHVATLADYVTIQASPASASPPTGGVVYNTVDGAVATLVDGVSYRQSFLASRVVKPPRRAVPPGLQDKVFKVGRTTGLTRGIVTQISTIVGPLPYSVGPCWFRSAFVIEGKDGTMFSDRGDSGAIIMKEDTGEVLGMLFAGNGVDNYACPMSDVLVALGCSIA